MAKWGLELLFTGIYLFGGICMLVYAIKKNKPFVLIVYGVVFLAAGWIFYNKGMWASHALLIVGILVLVFGIYRKLMTSVFAKNQTGSK